MSTMATKVAQRSGNSLGRDNRRVILMREERTCPQCRETYTANRRDRKFCSIRCSAFHRESQPEQLERRASRVVTPETRAKMSASQKRRMSDPAQLERLLTSIRGRRGPEVHTWRGDDAGYSAIHMWLRTNYPKTGTCERCSQHVGLGSKGTQYAYRFHPQPYTRNREDYRELCIPCHGLDRRGPRS